MSVEKTKTEPVQKKMGRPPQAEQQRKSMEVTIEDDYVVIKIPRKDLTKRLLAELL